jgi:hypothetical protein
LEKEYIFTKMYVLRIMEQEISQFLCLFVFRLIRNILQTIVASSTASTNQTIQTNERFHRLLNYYRKNQYLITVIYVFLKTSPVIYSLVLQFVYCTYFTRWTCGFVLGQTDIWFNIRHNIYKLSCSSTLMTSWMFNSGFFKEMLF